MSPPTRLASGERVGPYVIERHLASGGMGEVYVASAQGGERVALKVVAGTSPAAEARFEREQRALARLDHPNVVVARDRGRTDAGLAWLAMELLRGEDLAARLARAPLAPAEAVAVAAQVCDALEHAHARGVVHRDLKPQNLFLCEGDSPRVKVLDFGIARLADEAPWTATGGVVGTWAYMPPEQARGERDLDGRADLWSLGAVLFQCLAGRTPFTSGSPAGLLFQILVEPPPDLADLRPGLPPPLLAAVRAALSRDRDARPADAAALRAMLAAVPFAELPSAPPAPTAFESAPTAAPDPALTTERVRLVSAAYLRGVRDRALAEGVAQAFGARAIAVGGDAVLAVFGLDRWVGDEAERAVRFAAAVGAGAEGGGVATGRALLGPARVVGAAVDAAVALAARGGVTVDDATASLVRGALGVAVGDDGRPRVEPARPPTPADEADASRASPLVGRDAELGVLLGSARLAAAEVRPTAVRVTGAVGSGKTRLWREAARALPAAVEGARVLSARCDPARRDVPFAALRDALAEAVDPRVAEALADLARAGDAQLAQDRVRGSFVGLLRSLRGEGPLVLCVDDAQWLDAPSRSLLRWACDAAPDLPLALWLLARPEAREALSAAAPDAQALDLRPLERADAEALLRAAGAEATPELVERGGGNPRFLEALARLPRGAALPASVEGALLAWLDALAPAEQRFLRRAAVFGRSFWLEGVVALGGDAGAVPGLRRAGLVVPSPRGRLPGAQELAFRMGTLQEVAYAMAPAGLLAQRHLLAARWLAGREGAVDDEVAAHWELGGEPDRAAESFARAAEGAARAGDVATADARAARVLALTADPRIRWRALVARDDALQLAGDPARQAESVAALAALAPSLDDAARAEAAWRRCYAARVASDHGAALALGGEAVARASALGGPAAPRWGALAHAELALLRANRGEAGEALAHATAARDLAGRAGDPWLAARALSILAYVTAEGDDPAAGLELFDAAADAFARVGDRRREALARGNAGSLLLDLGRVEEAAARLGAAAETSRRVGNAPTAAVSTHNLGVALRLLGRLDDAEAHQSRAAADAARLRHARLASSAATERVYLALARGARAEELIERAAEAEQRASSLPAAALAASALAASLRARARAGVADAEAVARAHVAAAKEGDAARVELLAALVEVEGAGDDLAALRRALDRRAARAGADEDRAASRAALCARFLVAEGAR